MERSLRTRMLVVLGTVILFNLLACLPLIAGNALWGDGAGAATGLGVGMIAYLLGVRHAFDADHVAAIDNVTRRLRAAGQRPLGVGLFFSLGHATVVVALTAGAVLAARHVGALLPELKAWGSLIGTLISAVFLTLIGLVNLRFLARLLWARQADSDALPRRIERYRMVRNTDHSWKMFPLGMLFGLSFDTASEVALLALSVAAAHNGSVPLWAVMLLPLLFAAGMALMDTMESLLMLRLYDWAIADRDRTLRLNTVVTGISVCLALAVALYEWMDLYHRQAGFASPVPQLASSTVGLLATALLLALGSWAWLRRRIAETSAGQEKR